MKMKTHFGSALVILAVSVAVCADGAPPLADSATSTTKTVGLLSANGFPAPLTPGVTTVNRVPAASVHFVSDPARAQLFGPPPYSWQDLPFNTEIPIAARPVQSKATPAESHRVVEERNQAAIRRLVRDGGLSQAQQTQRRYEELMSRTEIFQPDVSYCSDQINILKTFLR